MPACLMRPHFFGKVSYLPNGHGRTVFAPTKCFWQFKSHNKGD